MRLKHWKFVGWIDAINTANDEWIQRVVTSTPFGEDEMNISWHLSTIPLPEGAVVGTFISVHRTKAGKWYAVNLSARMPNITESEVKRAKARAKQMRKKLGMDDPRHKAPPPTIG